MFRIALVNMPFASVPTPAFGLTQLQAVVRHRFGDSVEVDIVYANQLFAKHLGLDLYTDIASGVVQKLSGLGEWFFRQSAFPECEDNSDEYLQRYYPATGAHAEKFQHHLQRQRAEIDDVLGEIIDTFELDQATIVGFTSMFSQTVASLALARQLKQRNPSITTVMGGANCEWPMGAELARQVESIDFIFSGPALKSFPEFIECLRNGSVDSCKRINGVFAARHASASPHEVQLATRPLGDELPIDNTPALTYGPFLDTLEDNFPDCGLEPTLFFETSRGCWWGEKAHCDFCGLNGLSMKFRAMSPQKALRQFKELFSYSDRCSRFESSDNIAPTNYFDDVFPHVHPPPNVKIFYEVKADLSEGDVRALSHAGVKLIQPGIESLATSSLKLMRKGTTVFQNLLLLKHCVTYDVHPMWNLLIGFPGEPMSVYEMYANVIPRLFHLPPPTAVHPVRFDRYSPYYEESARYGLDLVPFDFYRLTYPYSSDALRNLAYFFTNRSATVEYKESVSRWMVKLGALVEEWRSRWYDADRTMPMLYVETVDERRSIVDTRRERVKCELSADEWAVVRCSTSPISIARLCSRTGRPLEHIERAVAALQAHCVLFQEGDRVFNLAFLEEPKEPFFRRRHVNRYRSAPETSGRPAATLPSAVFNAPGACWAM